VFKLEVMASAPATPAVPRGLRLSELAQQPEVLKPVPPVPVREARALAHAATPMAQAGHQAAAIPVISTSVVLAAARRSSEASVTTPPGDTGEPRRGFRLSDLKPLLNHNPRR
jgi:predicted component of type VI protein secretion system